MTPLQRFKAALQDACKNKTLVRFWTSEKEADTQGHERQIYRQVRSIHARHADLTGWDDSLPMEQRHTCRLDYPLASELKVYESDRGPVFAVWDGVFFFWPIRYYHFTDLTEEPPK